MTRKIVRIYDETNLRWIVNYYRVYDNSLTVQQFETPILSGRAKYVGWKTSRDDNPQWFGKAFLKEALAQFN
jgi:hypothetical protein